MMRCDEFLKALSDDTRRRILGILEKGEMSVSEIVEALKITQPNASHHLNILRVAGLVNNRRRGQQIYYSFNRDWFRSCCGDFLSLFECCRDFLKNYLGVDENPAELK